MTTNNRTEPGVCLECKGAGGGASNELCESCDGTGQQPAQPLDVSLLPMGDPHPIDLVRAGCDPITGKPAQPRRCCRKHEAEDLNGRIFGRLFIVCPTCRDKRCPHADDCANACSQQAAQPESGEVVRASLEEEATIESALRFSDSEYQMAFREGYIRAMTIADRRLTATQQRIAALESELENERARGIHTCHNQCQRPLCVAQRRIVSLESALSEAVEIMVHGERLLPKAEWVSALSPNPRR